MDLPAAKAEARKAALARRKAAHAGLGPAPEAATEALVQALSALPAPVIAGYLPIRTEIDPRPAMARLHAAGRRICVPVIEAPGLPLHFREWRPDSALSPGPFGAHVPEAGEWLTPAALIVPLVAFDEGLIRLGYGGGFYDRTLERLRAEAHAPAIGFAFSAQRAGRLPREATDQPLDAVVTEEGQAGIASPSGPEG